MIISYYLFHNNMFKNRNSKKNTILFFKLNIHMHTKRGTDFFIKDDIVKYSTNFHENTLNPTCEIDLAKFPIHENFP